MSSTTAPSGDTPTCIILDRADIVEIQKRSLVVGHKLPTDLPYETFQTGIVLQALQDLLVSRNFEPNIALDFQGNNK